MQVGVIGAGAVGGALAAALHRAGHSVEVTARGAHLAAIQRDGIHLSGAWGDYLAPVAADVTLNRAPELVILATKAQDATAALTANALLLRGIPLIVVQNGLDGVTGAVSAAPHSDVVGALALFASSLISPGHIEVTGPGDLYLGGGSRDHDVPERYAASVLADALTVHLTANFAGAQWSKLVVNQLNALPAITGLSVQEVFADPQLRTVLVASMRETVRIARASGIRFEPLQGLSDRRLRLFTSVPARFASFVPAALVRRMGTVPNPGSTLQSIRRGQLTEVEFLNGAVVRAAEGIGQTAPVNAALVELVHAVERSGNFFAPATVSGRIG